MGEREDRINFKPGANRYAWWSHLPVLEALLDLLPVRSALELGMGEGSTPLLHRRVPNLVSVESNATHLADMLARVPARPGFTALRHELRPSPNAPEELRYSALPAEVGEHPREQARAFYTSLAADHGPFDLVLVDQYAAVRDISLDALIGCSTALVLHDAEHCSQPADHPFHDCYWYNRFYRRADLTAFHHLRFDALGVHSDILLRRDAGVDLRALDQALSRNALAFHARLNDGSRPAPALRSDYRLAAPREVAA